VAGCAKQVIKDLDNRFDRNRNLGFSSKTELKPTENEKSKTVATLVCMYAK